MYCRSDKCLCGKPDYKVPQKRNYTIPKNLFNMCDSVVRDHMDVMPPKLMRGITKKADIKKLARILTVIYHKMEELVIKEVNHTVPVIFGRFIIYIDITCFSCKRICKAIENMSENIVQDMVSSGVDYIRLMGLSPYFQYIELMTYASEALANDCDKTIISKSAKDVYMLAENIIKEKVCVVNDASKGLIKMDDITQILRATRRKMARKLIMRMTVNKLPLPEECLLVILSMI